jgi:chorismate synthase
MMSIPAVKGVGIGIGFDAARLPGSEVHDEIHATSGRARTSDIARGTNRAGGLEGGMTNGEPIVVCVAMKPISTLMRPLATVEMKTREPALAVAERSDVTAVPAMGVIAESMLAFVVCQAVIEKFGGDSLGELKHNLDGYVARVGAHGP